MDRNCFYIQSQLKFKEQGVRNINSVFRSYNSGNIYLYGDNCYNHLYTHDEIMQHIGELQTYARMNNLHISGNLIVAQRGRNDISYEQIKVSLRNARVLPCAIKITAKTRETERKTPLTIEEKVALVLQYYAENDRLPTTEVVYNDFNLGKWFNDVHTQHSLYDSILHSVGAEESDDEEEEVE